MRLLGKEEAYSQSKEMMLKLCILSFYFSVLSSNFELQTLKFHSPLLLEVHYKRISVKTNFFALIMLSMMSESTSCIFSYARVTFSSASAT